MNRLTPGRPLTRVHAEADRDTCEQISYHGRERLMDDTRTVVYAKTKVRM